MTNVPNERDVQESILSWLADVGWTTYHRDGTGGVAGTSDADGSDANVDSATTNDEPAHGATVLDEAYDRRSNEVVYWDVLAEQVVAINDAITEDNVDRFLNSVRRDLDHEDLMEGNRAFHEILTTGKPFTVDQQHNGTRTVYVDLIDFENPANNRFDAVDEFEVSRTHTVRPDVTLLVNGIPLVQMELKSLPQDADLYDAITDLHQYEEQVPRLFVPALLNVAADTTALRYGAVGAQREFYEPWSDAPEQYRDDDEMRQAARALLNPETLLDVLKHFVLYERGGDADSKIVPRHMQYYAVHRIVDRIRAGEHDRGLVWHTQGSGKSITMFYTAANLLARDVMDAPQLFVVVDTDKLNSQMRDDLADLSVENWIEAESIEHLESIIESGRSELVVTTIQKFQDVDPDRQGNDEVVVMSDEAHRFMEADLGSRLDAALPDAYHFGFTGTPVREGEREKDRNTFQEFSPEGEEYLHRYRIKEGIDDELILPVYFTLRHEMEWDVDEAGLDEEFHGEVHEEFAALSKEEKLEFVRENVTSRMLAEIEPRVECIAEEIDRHFAGVEKNGWKGMVVTPSRTSAAMYGEKLVERRSEEEVAVLFTPEGDDEELLAQFHKSPEEQDDIVGDFEDEDGGEDEGETETEDDPKLLVVHKMLLTGFDAPVLKTMYLDRELHNHTLMQAIARTNRVAEGKGNGEIVDFRGVFENIEDALDYDEETRAHAAMDRSELFAELEEQLQAVLDIFEGIPRDDGRETIQKCLKRVSTNPEKGAFEQGFRRLQDLYESVAPDRKLVESDIQEEYRWLLAIYTAFRRNKNRDERPEDEMREKTREIIEEHVNVGEIKRDFPVYKLGVDELEAIEERIDPATQATRIAHAVREHLQPRVDQNPRYKRLSERVTEIVDQWDDGDRSAPETVEELKQVEDEVLEVEREARERGMSSAEFALYTELTEEREDAVESDEQAVEISRAIVEAFERRVDVDYEGWKENESVSTEIVRIVYDVLLKEFEVPDLLDDELVDDVRTYLVQNYD